MKNPSQHYPIIYIVWNDAYANADWMNQREYQEWWDAEKMQVHEIGWLLEETKNCIVMASRFNPGTGQYGNFQMIPKTWCKIEVLAKKSK